MEKELGNCYAKIRNPNSKFSHLDYLYGKDAHRILYAKVIGMMDTFEEKKIEIKSREMKTDREIKPEYINEIIEE